MRTVAGVMVALLLLIWLGAVLLISLVFPVWLVGVVVGWLFGFVPAKSTIVALDPTQVPLTPRIRLSYRDYDAWAQTMLRRSRALGWSRFGLDPFEAFSLWMATSSAGLHVWAYTYCILMLAPLDTMLAWFILSPDVVIPADTLVGFGVVSSIVVGHLGGWAAGLFYRRLRAVL